jgi:bile acid transporter
LVTIGFFAQYVIMPLLGWGVANLLKLPPAFAVGLILVACCPGGTASNVVTYIARADVALSVVMTLCSTLAAVVMTPLLTQWLAGAIVDVDAWGLLQSTVQVVLLPVMAGVALNRFAPRVVAATSSWAPLASVLGITLIVASIVGQNATAVKTSGGILLLAVVLLHAGGFAVGYVVARLLRCEAVVARTISIEVGMQNSGLGVVLAARWEFNRPSDADARHYSLALVTVLCNALMAILGIGVKVNTLPVVALGVGVGVGIMAGVGGGRCPGKTAWNTSRGEKVAAPTAASTSSAMAR